MHKSWGKIGIYAGAVGLLAGGAGLSLAPAALASSGQPAAASTASQHHTLRASALHRVSPFGAAAHRSAQHAAGQRAAGRTASPDTGSVLWVSNTAPKGHNTSCASPGYETISAALTKNNTVGGGDTIYVCSGTYNEQLAIISAVKLQAKGAVTVQGPASPSNTLTSCDIDGGSTDPNQDVVDICGPVTVSITGFTIQGGWPSTVCDNSLYGVAVLGGAKLNMSRSTVENIGGDPLTDGCQGGVGIEVGLATSATAADPGTATLSNDTVQSYQKNGITVDGTDSNATISNTTVTGAGPTPAIAQNGIQISDGATANISGGAVSGDECNDSAGGCGPDPVNDSQAVGILAYDSGAVSVTGTTVSDSDAGVYNIEDAPWAYYTPPSTPVPVTFTQMGLSNRYANAEFDQGTSTVTSSDFTGGEVGLVEYQYAGQAIPAQVTATGDTFTHATENALLVSSDQQAGDQPAQLTATGDTIAASNAGGLENDSFTVADATGNWWGASTGPSVWSFGKGSSVTSDVDFFPWVTKSTMTTMKTCEKGLSKSTSGNDVVLCATPGAKHANVANLGSGKVLLIANNGNDNLAGSNSGETWIIGSPSGADHINGNGGTGYIQERGSSTDVLTGAGSYKVAAN